VVLERGVCEVERLGRLGEILAQGEVDEVDCSRRRIVAAGGIELA
jgi:hypothetical protein